MAVRKLHLVTGALVAYSFVVSLVPTTLSYLNPEALEDISLTSGSLARQLQLSLLFLVAAIVLYRHRRQMSAVVRQLNPFLLLLLAYCLLSVLWSPYPVVTLKRVIILLGLLLVGLGVSPVLAGALQFPRILLATLMAICLLSAVTALAFPEIGIDPVHGTAWRGITFQKNTLGLVAAYGLVLWVFEWSRGEFRRSLCLAGLLFSAFVLVMARSSTSILMAVLGACVYGYWQRRWFTGDFSNGILALVALLFLLLLGHFYYVLFGQWLSWAELAGPIAGLFDKGTDLTGRTSIWHFLLATFQQHPVLGIGYGSFWLGEGSPAQAIADALGWMPPQGHDGYLDLLNELGVAGFGLFVLMLAWHLRSIVQLMRFDRSEAALHLAFLCIILASNVTETDFLSDTAFQNIVLIFSSTSLSARVFMLRQRHPGARVPAPHLGRVPGLGR